jgi:hypothetical protein
MAYVGQSYGSYLTTSKLTLSYDSKGVIINFFWLMKIF